MFCFFFFNDTATTEIYTLSLHDALPISECSKCVTNVLLVADKPSVGRAVDNATNVSAAILVAVVVDRKSTRLNSSHLVISYAVFCLKKKKMHYDKRQQYHNNHRTPLRWC